MQVTPELLEKYYLGLCTPEEARTVATWLENDDELGPIDREMVTTYASPDAEANIRRFLAEKTGLSMQASDSPLASGSLSANPRGRLAWLGVVGSAAAALLVAVLVGLWLYLAPKAPERSVAWQTVTTPHGKKATVTLPDGSKVQLNSGSTLRYPEQFTDSIRLVTLEGEGFFSVAPDAEKPFIVNSMYYTQVRVLGTAFNVRAYRADGDVEVSVQEGKVHFGNMEYRTASAILTAGQSAVYTVQTNRLEKSSTIGRAWAWKDNRLVFEKERLADIAKKLERWYGVNVTVKNQQVAGLRYSGTYRNPDLHELLASMKFVLGFSYRVDQENRNIVIY